MFTFSTTMPLSAFQCAAIYLLLLLPCKVMMCLTLLWTYMVDSVYRNLHFLLLFHCCNNSKSVKSWDWSRNARSVWEMCNERTKNGNLWPKTDPPPHRAHRFGFFCPEEYRRRRGEDPGSVVGGQPKLQLLLLLVQHLCLACFVQIEKCYVFSHHFSLPGEWDS